MLWRICSLSTNWASCRNAHQHCVELQLAAVERRITAACAQQVYEVSNMFIEETRSSSIRQHPHPLGRKLTSSSSATCVI